MSENPLENVLNLLQKSSDLVGTVVPSLQSASSDLNEVKNAVDKVNGFITDVKDVQKVFQVTRDVCYALDEVPGVDAISGVVGTVLSKVLDFMDPIVTAMTDFQKGLLKEAKSIVDEGARIAGEISTTATNFHTDVPKFINTANVLYFTVQLAIPLAKIMEGTSVGSGMKKLADEFTKIGSDVESTAKVIHEGLSDAWSCVKEIVEPAVKGFEDAFAFFAKLGAVNVVMEIMDPIKKALDVIFDALKPVMWALKAVECIFEKIVKPVIDEILKLTGIESLIEGLEHKIMDALGLTGIMHKLESAFHLEGLQRASGSLSGSSTKVSSYPQLKAAFGDFVSDPQQALMVAVVSAISGTVVRPGEPAPPLPPFPPDIQINGQTPPSTFLHSKMSVASSAYTPVVLHPFEPLIPGMVVISDADWPGVNTLLSDIAKTIESVKGIVPTGQTLDHALADVPNLEHAPQLLHSNLGDLFTIVKALHDLSSFLQEFPLLNVLLTPVTKSLSDEELAIQTLQRDTSQIVGYSNSIVTSIKLIMATEDSSLTNNLNQLMMTLQHWSHEIKSYTTQIDDGYARDAKLHNKYKQQLDSVKKKMLDRVADLAKVLASVSKLAEDLGNGGQKLSSEISELNTSLKSVQEPIYHLESAIVKVHSGVHVAQQLDSVFKPLQWLLTDFHCVPDKRPLKLEYLKFVKDFADGSSGLSIDKSAEAALKVLENEVFPIQSVSSTVKSAMSVLQSLSSSIPSQVTSYLSELKSLASTKIGSKTFTYRNPSGSVITIYSHFLDEGTVKEVLSLGKQLQDNPNII